MALDLARNYMEKMEMNPGDLLGRRTWSLSTGEKRALEIVAALVSPACLHVLDEPTAGLDPRRRAALGRLVGELGERGPILIASQDVEWLRSLTSRVVSLGFDAPEVAGTLA